MNFVELAAGGRLKRIAGFFEAYPFILESWPEPLMWRGG